LGIVYISGSRNAKFILVTDEIVRLFVGAELIHKTAWAVVESIDSLAFEPFCVGNELPGTASGEAVFTVTEKGIEELNKYYRSQGKSADHAEKVAELMMQFKLHDRAERFLRRMFRSQDDDTLQAAFVKLADVYLKTGRTDRISSLVTDYLGRTSNPVCFILRKQDSMIAAPL